MKILTASDPFIQVGTGLCVQQILKSVVGSRAHNTSAKMLFLSAHSLVLNDYNHFSSV